MRKDYYTLIDIQGVKKEPKPCTNNTVGIPAI